MNGPTDMDSILSVLRRSHLAGVDEEPHFVRLAGGVSSDIWRVETRQSTFCVKRALAKLKVEADWHAPITRNSAEAAWLQFVASWLPRAVPAVLVEDAALGFFAMTYFPATQHPVWKGELLAGRCNVDFAGQVGAGIAQIHRKSALSPALAARFPNHATFELIRIEPYFRATALRHPNLAPRLQELANATSAARIALVHGDVSPKNILCGPDGPIFLDAECATYGDPAFDLAFCLNHLILKSFLNPQHKASYIECFATLANHYLDSVDWEPAENLDRRGAQLLPALLLARIDGKSPVGYLNEPARKQAVRSLARELLINPAATLGQLRDRWDRAVPEIG